MTGTLVAILCFLGALTALGAWYARRVRTAEDFALAGRKLGAPILVGTLVATWMGTGSLFGNAEFAVWPSQDRAQAILGGIQGKRKSATPAVAEFSGEVGEILLYGRIAPTDGKRLRDYLAAKWTRRR